MVLFMAEQTTTTNAAQDTQDASQSTPETSATVNSTESTKSSQATPETSIEELIQKAVDRATNKLGNDNKKLREALTKMQKEHLDENQLKALELQEKEADIADREAKLQDKINREFALNAIKEAGLDDGGKDSMKLIDFVVCNTEEETLNRVKAFGELVDRFVKAEVDKTFKTHGRNPNGTSTATDVNKTVVESIGILAAERQKNTEDVLNHYIGR